MTFGPTTLVKTTIGIKSRRIMTPNMTVKYVILSVNSLSQYAECRYARCRSAECRGACPTCVVPFCAWLLMFLYRYNRLTLN
jgi:hypothetical protein